MTKLKPCPFCGAEFVPALYGPQGWYHTPDGTECPGNQIMIAPYFVSEFNIRHGEREAYLAGWRAARDTILEIVKGYTKVPASHGAEPFPADKEAALFVGLTMCEEIRDLPEPSQENGQ